MEFSHEVEFHLGNEPSNRSFKKLRSNRKIPSTAMTKKIVIRPLNIPASPQLFCCWHRHHYFLKLPTISEIASIAHMALPQPQTFRDIEFCILVSDENYIYVKNTRERRILVLEPSSHLFVPRAGNTINRFLIPSDTKIGR